MLALLVACMTVDMAAGERGRANANAGTGAADSSMPYDELVLAIDAEGIFEPADLRRAFRQLPDFADRMQAMEPLEHQALDVLGDEPIRLGALGSAIIDLYQGSLTGHQALAKFYHYFASDEEAEQHRRFAGRIVESIRASGDGTASAPYVVATLTEAKAFLLESGQNPIGTIYHITSQTGPLMVNVLAKPKEGPTESHLFDLTMVFEAARLNLPDDIPREGFNPPDLVGKLASDGDPTAQTFIGFALMRDNRAQEAIPWLRRAADRRNVIANIMLARAYRARLFSMESESEREIALERITGNYVQAVAAGSDEAMVELGRLYLEGLLGEDQAEAGIEHLRRAAELDNAEAMVVLAGYHYAGGQVARDFDQAEHYYQQAAEQGHALARIQYARFLMDEEVGKPFTAEAYDWLRGLADEDNTEAMLLLGNVHAKGVLVKRNYRKARRWFKQAVTREPDNPGIVNEVAWTLTVSHLEKLRNIRYALKIMDAMMENSQSARRVPAYLDTWAAAYAANGNFERAVTIQQEALDLAINRNETETIDILRKHLEAFRAGETISDIIP